VFQVAKQVQERLMSVAVGGVTVNPTAVMSRVPRAAVVPVQTSSKSSSKRARIQRDSSDVSTSDESDNDHGGSIFDGVDSSGGMEQSGTGLEVLANAVRVSRAMATPPRHSLPPVTDVDAPEGPPIPVTDSVVLQSLDDAARTESLRKLTEEWLPHSTMTLLYRGSRDGMNAKMFHVRCNHKGATLTLIRAEDGSVFGAYASKAWIRGHGVYVDDPASFLFTLHHASGRSSSLKKACVDASSHHLATKTLYCRDNHGPVFGAAASSNLHALYISSGGKSTEDFSAASYSLLKDGETYEGPRVHGLSHLTSSYKFTPREVEVFLVDAVTSNDEPVV
jgi:hypothetical protein